MNVLITGATGFIGANLVRFLLSKGHEITAIIRNSPEEETWRIAELTKLKIIYYEDLFSDFQRARQLRNIDTCIHLASYGVNYNDRDIVEIVRGNIDLSLNVIKLCDKAEIGRIIMFGSAMEYGNSTNSISEDFAVDPTSIYGAAKASSVIMARTFAGSLGIGLAVIRPFGIYGPYEGFHKVIPQMIRACLVNESLGLTQGEQVRDYLYVEDLCNAVELILRKATVEFKSIFNVCSGTGVTIRDIGKEILHLTGKSDNILRFGEKEYRVDENMYIVGSSDKIRGLVGWYPKIELREGLRRSIEWYKEYLGA